MIKASIVGASGYGGGELVRLLSGHRHVEIVAATAMQQQGRRVDESFPSLRSFNDLTMEAPDWEALARASDVVFLALPHGVSQDGAPKLLEAGARVIDIAADFRLKDLASHQQWYGAHKAPELLASAVYGLPELHADEIARRELVACPGCYPTASILATLPALEWREPGAPIIVDAKSGVSGAGRNPGANNHFSEVNENVRPYNLGRHRHTAEMLQEFAAAGAPRAGVVLAAPGADDARHPRHLLRAHQRRRRSGRGAGGLSAALRGIAVRARPDRQAARDQGDAGIELLRRRRSRPRRPNGWWWRSPRWTTWSREPPARPSSA